MASTIYTPDKVLDEKPQANLALKDQSAVPFLKNKLEMTITSLRMEGMKAGIKLVA